MKHQSIVATGGYLALSCVGFIASAPVSAEDGEPIIVTGTATTELTSPKATAPLVDTPRTVSVILRETIENTASFSIDEALRTVPGITLGAGEGGTSSGDAPLIRGVNSTGDIFVDGVRDVGSQQREAFAVESIEVTKGPNGPMAGRGGAGGTINLVSKLARRGSSVAGSATAGTADLMRLTGDVNQQLSDDVAVRLVGLYHDSMVPGRDRVADDRWGVLPSVTFGLDGPLTATLSYYHLQTSGIPDYGIPLTSRRQLNPNPADPDIRIPAEVDPDNFYGLLARDFQRTNVDAVTGTVSAELAPNVVLSNTTRLSWTHNNYIVTNPDDSAGNVARGIVWRNIKSRNAKTDSVASNLNLAAEFATGAIAHSVAAGFEYSDTDQANVPYAVATGNRACGPADVAAYNCTSLFDPNPADPWTGLITVSPLATSAHARDTSVYLFDTVTVLPQLLVSGGVRWTDYRASADGFTSGVPFSAASRGDFWSWQVGAIFKPTPQVSIYASYGTSKSPPGASVGEGEDGLTLATQLQAPQGTENWELGAKAELLGGKLLVAGALLQIDRSNIQQTDPTGTVTEVFAAARTKGVEFSATGHAGPVTMLVGYTFLDAKLPGNAPANAGKALPQTPKHNLAATLDWQVTPALSIGGGAYGASKRFADAPNLISAEGYIRFDAHAEYKLNPHLGLRVNLNNVIDNRYVVKLRNPHFAVPADGRQALVTLTARY